MTENNVAIDNKARQLLSEMPTKVNVTDDTGKILHSAVGSATTNAINLKQSWLGNGGIVNPGGNTGGDGGDHPSADVDYYAGSLANGEITERYLLWNGPSDPSSVTTATLLQDVGAKMNMVGDGITLLVHLQKTAFVAGTKGEVSDLPLNYDTANILKDGYFTTTSPYPIYIKASDLVVGKQVSIPINGIGEGLSGKNVKAPKLYLTFKADKTIDIETSVGYDNDGDSAGATGANYEVVVDVIATFSTQTAVAQIPPSVNFFTGSAINDIALSGASDFFENTSDGIKITFDNHFSVSGGSYGYDISNFGMQSVVNIDKKMLIVGYKYKLNSKDFSGYQKTIKNNSGGWETKPGVNATGFDVSKKDYYITIGKGFINSNTGIDYNSGSNVSPDWLKMNVLSISSYRN